MCFNGSPSMPAPPPPPEPKAAVQEAVAPAVDGSDPSNLTNATLSNRSNIDASRFGKNRLRIDLGATGDTGNTNGLSVPA